MGLRTKFEPRNTVRKNLTRRKKHEEKKERKSGEHEVVVSTDKNDKQE